MKIIKEYWGWTGIRPARIIDRNQFGNLLIEDSSARFWRLCPEELSCKIIAKGLKDLKPLLEDEEFKKDWEMLGFSILAGNSLGELDGEQCYYFIKSPMQGGEYALDNIGLTTFSDLIIDSGIAAQQVAEKEV